jgi:hypothetical protein
MTIEFAAIVFGGASNRGDLGKGFRAHCVNTSVV